MVFAIVLRVADALQHYALVTNEREYLIYPIKIKVII